MELIAILMIVYSFYNLVFFSNDRSLLSAVYYFSMAIFFLLLGSERLSIAFIIYIVILLNVFYLTYKRKTNA